MSSEEIDLRLSLAHPRRALARLEGSGERLQWWVPNVAGHRRMVYATGFEVLRATSPYSLPFGEGHPARRATLRSLPARAFRSALTGNMGVPHAAVLARPRV